MGAICLLLYCFATGLLVTCGAGTILELTSGRTLGFTAPFVARERIGRSLAIAMIAGPPMLLSEALAARDRTSLSGSSVLGCAAASGLWALAVGILIVHLAVRMVNA